jgi:hypothetical protein
MDSRLRGNDTPHFIVMPAKAGIQGWKRRGLE